MSAYESYSGSEYESDVDPMTSSIPSAPGGMVPPPPPPPPFDIPMPSPGVGEMDFSGGLPSPTPPPPPPPPPPAFGGSTLPPLGTGLSGLSSPPPPPPMVMDLSMPSSPVPEVATDSDSDSSVSSVASVASVTPAGPPAPELSSSPIRGKGSFGLQDNDVPFSVAVPDLPPSSSLLDPHTETPDLATDSQVVTAMEIGVPPPPPNAMLANGITMDFPASPSPLKDHDDWGMVEEVGEGGDFSSSGSSSGVETASDGGFEAEAATMAPGGGFFDEDMLGENFGVSLPPPPPPPPPPMMAPGLTVDVPEMPSTPVGDPALFSGADVSMGVGPHTPAGAGILTPMGVSTPFAGPGTPGSPMTPAAPVSPPPPPPAPPAAGASVMDLTNVPPPMQSPGYGTPAGSSVPTSEGEGDDVDSWLEGGSNNTSKRNFTNILPPIADSRTLPPPPPPPPAGMPPMPVMSMVSPPPPVGVASVPPPPLQQGGESSSSYEYESEDEDQAEPFVVQAGPTMAASVLAGLGAPGQRQPQMAVMDPLGAPMVQQAAVAGAGVPIGYNAQPQPEILPSLPSLGQLAPLPAPTEMGGDMQNPQVSAGYPGGMAALPPAGGIRGLAPLPPPPTSHAGSSSSNNTTNGVSLDGSHPPIGVDAPAHLAVMPGHGASVPVLGLNGVGVPTGVMDTTQPIAPQGMSLPLFPEVAGMAMSTQQQQGHQGMWGVAGTPVGGMVMQQPQHQQLLALQQPPRKKKVKHINVRVQVDTDGDGTGIVPQGPVIPVQNREKVRLRRLGLGGANSDTEKMVMQRHGDDIPTAPAAVEDQVDQENAEMLQELEDGLELEAQKPLLPQGMLHLQFLPEITRAHTYNWNQEQYAGAGGDHSGKKKGKGGALAAMRGTWHGLRKRAKKIILFSGSLRRISGVLGSSTASYFVLSRWLFVVNTLCTAVWMALFFIPAHEPNSTPPLAGTPIESHAVLGGAWSSSPLYYYSYTASSSTGYYVDIFFMLCLIVTALVSLLGIILAIGRRYRMAFQPSRSISNSHFRYTSVLMGGFDHTACKTKDAVVNTQLSIRSALLELLREDSENKRQKMTLPKTKWTRIMLNAAVVFGAGLTTAYIVLIMWLHPPSSGGFSAESEMDDMLFWFAVPAGVVISQRVMVFFISTLPAFEAYKSTFAEIRITTIRAMFFRLSNLVALVLGIYVFATDPSGVCGELILGKMLTRILLFDLALDIVVTMLARVLRSCGSEKIEFDVAESTLLLAYRQLLAWMAMGPAPGVMPMLAVGSLLVFYAKRWYALGVCRAPRRALSPSFTERAFFFVLLFCLIVAIAPLVYWALYTHPTCGIFMDSPDPPGSVVEDRFATTTSFLQVAGTILSQPAFWMFLTLILLSLIYLKAVQIKRARQELSDAEAGWFAEREDKLEILHQYKILTRGEDAVREEEEEKERKKQKKKDERRKRKKKERKLAEAGGKKRRSSSSSAKKRNSDSPSDKKRNSDSSSAKKRRKGGDRDRGERREKRRSSRV